MKINRTLFRLIFGSRALTALDDLTDKATQTERLTLQLQQAQKRNNTLRQHNGDLSAQLNRAQQEVKTVSQRNAALTTSTRDVTTLYAENVKRTRAVTVTYAYPEGTDPHAATADATDTFLAYLMDGVSISTSGTPTGELQVQTRLSLDTITLQRLAGTAPTSSNEHATPEHELSATAILAATHGGPVYTKEAPITPDTRE